MSNHTKTRVLSIRVTDEQSRAIDRLCGAFDLKVSEVARAFIPGDAVARSLIIAGRDPRYAGFEVAAEYGKKLA